MHRRGKNEENRYQKKDMLEIMNGIPRTKVISFWLCEAYSRSEPFTQ